MSCTGWETGRAKERREAVARLRATARCLAGERARRGNRRAYGERGREEEGNVEVELSGGRSKRRRFFHIFMYKSLD
eukprot:757944-Hanusia_phi.AAC.2